MAVEGVKASRQADANVRSAEREARRAEQNAKNEESNESKRTQAKEGKGSKVDTEA